MSRTRIDVGTVIDSARYINSAKSFVSSAKSSFAQTRNSVDGKIQSRSNIRGRLTTVQNQLANIDSQISRIGSMVQYGANLYRSTDRTVITWGAELRSGIKGVVGGASVGRIANTWDSWFKKPDVKELADRVIEAGRDALLERFKEAEAVEKVIQHTGAATAGVAAAKATEAQKEAASVLEQVLKDDWKLEGAVLGDSVTGEGEFLGVNASGTASGELIGGSINTKSKATWNFEEKDVELSKSISAEGHLAKGSLQGNYGILGGKLEGKVGNVGATGSLGASLFKDGKFLPSLQAKLEGKASVLEGEAEVKVGNEEFNGHIKGEGTVLGAEAGMSGGAGMITYKDETTGQTKTELGLEGKLEAEAYLAEGTVSGGITIFGIDIDVGLTGKAGGVGVEAGGRVTTGGVSGKIGAGLGLGAGLELSIDWSDFSLW